jgi:hypothetical protein
MVFSVITQHYLIEQLSFQSFDPLPLQHQLPTDGIADCQKKLIIDGSLFIIQKINLKEQKVIGITNVDVDAKQRAAFTKKHITIQEITQLDDEFINCDSEIAKIDDQVKQLLKKREELAQKYFAK